MLAFFSGSAFLLILTVVLNDNCKADDKTSDACPGLLLSKSNFLQILVSVEMAIILPVLLVYLGKYTAGTEWYGVQQTAE